MLFLKLVVWNTNKVKKPLFSTYDKVDISKCADFGNIMKSEELYSIPERNSS